MAAYYTWLENGKWGVRVQGPIPNVGQIIAVTLRSGEVKTETITAILKTDKRGTLATFVDQSEDSRIIWDSQGNVQSVSREEHAVWLEQKRCTALRADGQRCRAFARMESRAGACVVHDPERKAPWTLYGILSDTLQ